MDPSKPPPVSLRKTDGPAPEPDPPPVSLTKPSDQTQPPPVAAPSDAVRPFPPTPPPVPVAPPPRIFIPAPPPPIAPPQRSRWPLFAALLALVLLAAVGSGVAFLGSSGSSGKTQVDAVPASEPAQDTPTEPEVPTEDPTEDPTAEPTADSTAVTVVDDSGSPLGPAIATAFQTYVDGINDQDPAAAYAVLSDRAQSRTPLDAFSSGISSTTITAWRIVSISTGSPRVVEVTFRSTQDAVVGGTGQTCSDWAISYTMVEAGGWRIDRSKPHPGSPVACA